MNFELVNSLVSLMTLIPIIAIFLISAHSSPFGAVSLPCMTMITTVIYFYLMPVVVLANGDEGLFGLYMGRLDYMHLAVLLYALGAGAAFLASWRTLSYDPSRLRARERVFNFEVFVVLWAIALLAIAFQVATGRLNLAGSDSYEGLENGTNLLFLTQANTMIASLTVVTLVRERFSRRSLLLFTAVFVILVQVGFRGKIMLLLAGAATAYALVNKFRINLPTMLGGAVSAIFLANFLGSIRRYGNGINLAGMDEIDTSKTLSSFGGEFGPVYVFNYFADHPVPELVTFEPWLVGIALVPSAIWPDKPFPEYLKLATLGMPQAGAEKAGVAAPQHVEILLQFGWSGLPVLAFMYFSLACLLQSQLLKQGHEARIAGCALIPAFFGFQMQTRGYFNQTLSDGLFLFGPLFFLSAKHSVARASLTGRLRNLLGQRSKPT